MNKPISTRMHGILDYATAPTLFALPRLLKWGPKLTNLLTGLAAGHFSYSMITRYELGLIKILPMRGHLTIDTGFAAVLAAAPFVLLKKYERTGDKIGVLLGLGVYEFISVLLTQPDSPLDQTDDAEVVPGIVEELIIAKV